MTPVRTVARAMLGAIFIVQGAQTFTSPEHVAPRAKPLTDRLTPLLSKAGPKMPTEAEALVKLNGAVHVAGGLLMVTSLRRPAAAVLAASLVPTTLAGHAFWESEEPTERAMQRVQFLKNLGLLGGLILAAADTEGRPSLSYRAAASRTEAAKRRNKSAASRRAKAESAKAATSARAASARAAYARAASARAASARSVRVRGS